MIIGTKVSSNSAPLDGSSKNWPNLTLAYGGKLDHVLFGMIPFMTSGSRYLLSCFANSRRWNSAMVLSLYIAVNRQKSGEQTRLKCQVLTTSACNWKVFDCVATYLRLFYRTTWHIYSFQTFVQRLGMRRLQVEEWRETWQWQCARQNGCVTI